MSKRKIFDPQAWDDYQWFVLNDRRIVRRINALIADVERHGNEGIGKPEALRANWSGWYSRRITDEHRLIYQITDDAVIIAACRFHYGDK